MADTKHNHLLNQAVAVVVLYNPHENEFNRIVKHSKIFAELIVIDNSSTSFKDRLLGLPGVQYVGNMQNYGIAKAFNQGLAYANKHSYKYCLMMDQDSEIDKQSVLNLIRSFELKPEAFICTSTIQEYNQSETTQALEESQILQIPVCISSGSLVNVSLLEKVGYHDEKMFIDYVDFEICLRAAKFGLYTYQVKGATLKHQLGDQKKHELFGFTFYPTHHSALRKYYKTRNMLYVFVKYFTSNPKWVLQKIKFTLYELILMVMFESNKLKKIKAYLFGFKDFILGNYQIRKKI
ncbi:MAG: glycosyltransferase [Fibrobacterales bacterium]